MKAVQAIWKVYGNSGSTKVQVWNLPGTVPGYLPESTYNMVQVDKKIKFYSNNCYVIKNLIK